MDEPRTPDHVLADIRSTRTQLLGGPDALYDNEVKAETAELAAHKAEDLAFISAEGSVEMRKAAARLAAEEDATKAVVARAAHNRAKALIRALESSLMSLQAELKWMKEEGL